MAYCERSNQEKFPFTLPDLPFNANEFKPHFSVETFEYHHGKHHNAYVTNLNKILEANQEMAYEDLEKIILLSKDSNPAIFNNAAQIWNHTFFWHSIKPNGGGKPDGEILTQIEKDFGSYEQFATEFKQAAATQFGSGWAWLVFHNQKLQIVKTANADTPITDGMHPILNCDVWEHAYYIDYRNKRPDYLDTFMKHMINWDFANKNFAIAKN